MLFKKSVGLYEWWFYKSLYRSILDIKRVFFLQQQTFDPNVMEFEREKDTVLIVNIGDITVLESK